MRRYLPFLVLFLFYCWVAWVARGGDTWWHIDILVQNPYTGIFWGDDAYRFFLARHDWSEQGLYSFNFALPGAVILDRVLAELISHNQIHVRYALAALSAATIYMVFRGAKYLTDDTRLSALSAFLLALMPLYALVSLSFYGESWMMFFISAITLSFFLGHVRLSTILVALLPLIRPEGIVFVLAFCLYGLIRRDWVTFFLAPSLGFAYLCYLIFWGAGLEPFWGWRESMWQAQSPDRNELYGDLSDITRAFTVFWIVPAAIGAFAREVRPYWPFALAVFLFCIGQSVLIATNGIYAEIRYFTPVFPLIAVFWAVGVRKLINGIKARSSLKPSWILVPLAVYIFLFHITQLDVVRQVAEYRFEHGKWPKIEQDHFTEAFFRNFDEDYLENMRVLASSLHKTLETNPDIDVMMVSLMQLYHFLDPGRIPDHVTVVFPTLGWTAQKKLYGDRGAGYFAKPPFGGYFTPTYPESGQPKMLYVGNMGDIEYEHHRKVGTKDVYLFGYRFQKEYTPGSRREKP
jgi:hypothetical protein